MSQTAPLVVADEGYVPVGGAFDEAVEGDGSPRWHYQALLGALRQTDLEGLTGRVSDRLGAREVGFGTGARRRTFAVDPVPRIIPAAEWVGLEAGVAQRVRALNAFLADAYGDQRIVNAGRVPPRLIADAVDFEPMVAGFPPSGRAHAHIAGLDVVRDAGGKLLALEDNLRTPSGIAYADAARDAVGAHLPAGLPTPRPLEGAVTALAATLRAAAPDSAGEPAIVLLSDGPSNTAWWEHTWLADRLGIPVVSLEQLEPHGSRLFARIGRSRRQVDVVYRRTDGHRLADSSGSVTPVARVMLAALQAGRVACVNGFGTGVADDKLTYAYVEEMVRFYLDEAPLLPSVPTYDLGEPGVREEALARLGDLVVKPRSGYGGHGVVVCADAEPADVEAAAERIRRHPERFVAQETVMLSTHPTVQQGALVPRHVDLRPFALSSDAGVTVPPGGLTRVAFDPGSLVVNTSQNGGGKDTWVLSE